MAARPIEPNFFIIGAPKCGTTALSEYLRAHPRVFITDPKEPNFFDDDFDYHWLGVPERYDEYLRLYQDARPEHLARGEATVWYLYSEVAARRIHDVLPEARLIAMVRDPLELVQSLHSQLCFMYDETVEDFEQAWRLQRERREGRCLPKNVRQPAFLQYAEVARVSRQLERFLGLFPREQLMVIVYDDFRRDARSCYRSALEHLGVEDDGRTDFSPVNASKVHRWRRLAALSEKPPAPALALARGIKKAFGLKQLRIRPALRRMNRQERRRAPIAPVLAEEIRQGFASEVRALSDLSGRDVSAWTRGETVPPPC